MEVIYKQIDTKLDAFSIFSIFKDEKELIFLDSGMDPERLGRFSIIVFSPFFTLKGKEEEFIIVENEKIEIRNGNAFELLREILNRYNFINKTHLPFIAGGVGYLAYELCRELEEIPKTGLDDVKIPDLYFNFYKGSIVIDNLLHKVYLTYLNIDQKSEQFFNYIEHKIAKANIITSDKYSSKKNTIIKSNFTKEEYIKAIKKVKDYIKNGDVYEVNLTQRFETVICKQPYEIYCALREINKAPFAAYMNLEELNIISSSPERFLKIKNKEVETRPIKGTIKRGNNIEEDEKNREFLANSEKDKAELLMIVDLVRNDLSIVCKKGTVKVEELFKLEEYPTVYHLVSTVVGQLKDNMDVIDCLKAAFPGGSITGAPKIRSMEIIDELEPNLRNVYTGSIGYIGFDGNADLNIVIRTIVIKENKAYFGVGGAITWDSDEEAEYKETLDKGQALMRVL